MLKKLIAAYGLFGFGYVVTATFIEAMARRLDHGALLEPLTWIVVGLLATPSVLAWQRLAQRFGVFAALRLTYDVEVAGVLPAGFASGHVAVVAGGHFYNSMPLPLAVGVVTAEAAREEGGCPCSQQGRRPPQRLRARWAMLQTAASSRGPNS